MIKYKQALRGLFIIGTSSLPLAETTEKVGDEPGLTLRHAQDHELKEECLAKPCGYKP